MSNTYITHKWLKKQIYYSQGILTVLLGSGNFLNQYFGKLTIYIQTSTKYKSSGGIMKILLQALLICYYKMLQVSRSSASHCHSHISISGSLFKKMSTVFLLDIFSKY